MDFIDARRIYNTLPVHTRVEDALVYPLVVGTVRFERSALVALDLEDLFSGRHMGDAVQQRVLDAMWAAARTQKPKAGTDLFFEVDFGIYFSPRALVASDEPEAIVVRAASERRRTE